jgi:photosystem II stability/assembly factor-like uncharacterized protein
VACVRSRLSVVTRLCVCVCRTRFAHHGAVASGQYEFALYDLRYVDSNEIWVAGSMMGHTTVGGAWFIHSLDGGHTWTQVQNLMAGAGAMLLATATAA